MKCSAPRTCEEIILVTCKTKNILKEQFEIRKIPMATWSPYIPATCSFPVARFAICLQLINSANLSIVSLKMKMSKTLKKVTKCFRKKRSDRVYVYDEEVEAYRRSRFARFYGALGFIHVPRREKYQPEVRVRESPLPLPSRSTSVEGEEWEVEGVEVLTLEGDLPPRTEEGEQLEPLPVIIAWEYPEEQMPVFLDFHYFDRGY